ncbi:MAG TPA: rod shape-determining protein RodA, partial [Bacteroidales bacterium]|nr:rod shape-determining protein RodA [Bacteroidales bacterium]
SRSWFEIGSFRLQPAEFAKMATALAMARFASKEQFKLGNFRNLTVIALIICLPVALILLQNDAGSALVYSAFIFVLYREGMNPVLFALFFLSIALFVLALITNHVILLALVAVVGFVGFTLMSKKTSTPLWGLLIFALVTGVALAVYYSNLWLYPVKYLAMLAMLTASAIALVTVLIKKTYRALPVLLFLVVSTVYISSVDYVYSNVLGKHQQDRIGELLGFNSDPLGAGYNVNQSKISIGSGGFTGKGFLKGTQTKYNFVPEQDTDFIFCTVGEEWGFAGSFLVLSLFCFLILRIVWLAERQRSKYSRIYGYCVASILFFHVAVNIAMTIGLAPVIGIPLPFFSYGGSSLWAFTLLLMIFLRLDANRMEVFR